MEAGCRSSGLMVPTYPDLIIFLLCLDRAGVSGVRAEPGPEV